MNPFSWKTIVAALKAALAFALAFLVGLHPVVQVLLALMGLDVLTGLIVGFVEKKLSTKVSFRGLAKKAVILILVGAGEIVSHPLGIPELGALIAGFYAASEGLSIVENAVVLGLPVPKVLRDALAKLSPEKFPEEVG